MNASNTKDTAKAQASLADRISSEILWFKPKTEEAGEENSNCFKNFSLPEAEPSAIKGS
jgi:hypothetical protein